MLRVVVVAFDSFEVLQFPDWVRTGNVLVPRGSRARRKLPGRRNASTYASWSLRPVADYNQDGKHRSNSHDEQEFHKRI